MACAYAWCVYVGWALSLQDRQKQSFAWKEEEKEEDEKFPLKRNETFDISAAAAAAVEMTGSLLLAAWPQNKSNFYSILLAYV